MSCGVPAEMMRQDDSQVQKHKPQCPQNGSPKTEAQLQTAIEDLDSYELIAGSSVLTQEFRWALTGAGFEILFLETTIT